MSEIDTEALLGPNPLLRLLADKLNHLEQITESALVRLFREDAAIRQALSAVTAAGLIVAGSLLPVDTSVVDEAGDEDARRQHAVVDKTHILTARERQVLTLIAGGLTQQQTADRLAISRHTVANHVAHVRVKLNASGAEHAVAIGIRSGLI